MVLLYASRYSDVATIVNLCGRFDLQCDVKERIGEVGLQEIQEKGYVEVKSRTGILLNFHDIVLFIHLICKGV